METAYLTIGDFSFRAGFTDFGLCGLTFRLGRPYGLGSLSDRGKALRMELSEYFAGKRREFSVPRDLEGVTDFQFKVYEQLLMIPYGETASYGEIAERVGRPGGARAVGQANKRNPIGIIVPCHRVIASDGSLGGYGGGYREDALRLKRMLLEIEGAKLRC
jgi:methylated-DNA-[protein]-cysteine S-methyltransferase